MSDKAMLVTAEDRTESLLQALSKAGYLDDDWWTERDGDGRSDAERLVLAAFRVAVDAGWKEGLRRAIQAVDIRGVAQKRFYPEGDTGKVLKQAAEYLGWIRGNEKPPVGLQS